MESILKLPFLAMPRVYITYSPPQKAILGESKGHSIYIPIAIKQRYQIFTIRTFSWCRAHFTCMLSNTAYCLTEHLQGHYMWSEIEATESQSLPCEFDGI